MMSIKSIISSMTLEDKISLCTGADFWHTKAMPQYGIPAIMMSDGPHGLRCQPADADMLGINQSIPATCFPTAVTAEQPGTGSCTPPKAKPSARKALRLAYP